MAGHWILIIILVAVVAMIVGPIMMLQPNATQRKQEKLRSRALALGLQVKMTSLPQQATDSEAPAAIPVYCLPHAQARPCLSEWLLRRSTYVHESHFFQEWFWSGEHRSNEQERQWLLNCLPNLPPSVVALSCNAGGICVYWAEMGGDKMLQELVDLLHTYGQATNKVKLTCPE